MADLTESEKKMIRNLCFTIRKRHLIEFNSQCHAFAEAALSELLLAAKERAVSSLLVGDIPQQIHDGDMSVFDLADKIRNSDWSDLFKEKV